MAEAPIRISATDETKAAFASVIGNMKRAEAGAKSFTASFDGLSSLTGKLGALSVAITGASIGKLVTDGIAAQAALDDLSESTSLSVETLSQLQNVTRLTGADLNTVAASAGKFARSVAEARTGNADLVAAFRAVGISADDLKNKNFDDLFVEFAQAIANAKDPTDALGVAVKLAGKSAADVIPFFKDLAREGLSVAGTTTAQAAAAERLQNEFRSIRRAALDLRDTLANLLVPALARFIEEFRALKSLNPGEIISSSLLSINRNTLENAGAELAKLDQQINQLRNRGDGAAPLDPRVEAFVNAEIAGLEKKRSILEKLIASIGQQRRAARESETPRTPPREVRLPPEAPRGRPGGDIDAVTRAQLAALPPDDDTGVDLEGRSRGVQQRNEELARRLDSLVSDTAVRRTADLQEKIDFLAQALADGKVTAAEYAEAVNRLVDPADRAGEATRKLQADVEAAFGDTAIARAQRLQAVIDEINRQADAGTRNRAQADQAIANLIGDTNRQTETTSNAARDLGLIFSSSFEQAVSGGRGLRDILKGIEADILKLGTRKLLTEPFLEFLSPTRPGGAPGAGGGFGDIFGSILKSIGFRANGGPVMAGGGYIVGERGPEFFVPTQSGTIVPNGAMSSSTIVFNISTPDVNSFRASQGQLLAQARSQMNRAGRNL